MLVWTAVFRFAPHSKCECPDEEADMNLPPHQRQRMEAETDLSGMRRGMGEIDRTGQGMLETYQRKLEQVQAQDWFTTELSPKQVSCHPDAPCASWCTTS